MVVVLQNNNSLLQSSSSSSVLLFYCYCRRRFENVTAKIDLFRQEVFHSCLYLEIGPFQSNGCIFRLHFLKMSGKNYWITHRYFTYNVLFCFVSDFLPGKISSTNEYTISLDNKTNHYLAVEHGKMVVKVGVPLKVIKQITSVRW